MDRKQLTDRLSVFITLYEDLKEDLMMIDPRIQSYVYTNLFEPEKHGIYEILAVGRFLSFFNKYDFSIKDYRRYITFAEQLKIPSKDGMRAFRLEPFQCFLMANIWGWKHPDGTRVTRDALFYVPRKASKTSLIAQLAIYDLLFGPPDSQCFVASNSFNQSKICFDIISNAITVLDPKMKNFRRTREKVYSVIPGKQSFIQCLSSEADRLDGLNANLIIMDEWSQADTAQVRNVLTSSQGTRDNPLIVTITTASTKLESPFVNMLNKDKKILEGEIDNDSIFAAIFEAEEGDDISDPAVWHRVQPMLGISVKEQFYKESYKNAMTSAEDMIEFRTKLLNIFCQPITTQWIKTSMITRNLVHLNLSDITTRPVCMVGVDLSVSDDISAVAYGLYDSISKSFTFYVDYYIPKQTIETHFNKELYQRWVEQGYLHICGDEVIDYEQIGKDILANSKHLNILSIGYDSYKSKDLVNYLRASGVKCLQAYKQTYANFTAPVESFEMGLAENKIKLVENPITQWMFNNVVIDTDNMENKKPIKVTANRKIDGVITILESLGQFMAWKR